MQEIPEAMERYTEDLVTKFPFLYPTKNVHVVCNLGTVHVYYNHLYASLYVHSQLGKESESATKILAGIPHTQ